MVNDTAAEAFLDKEIEKLSKKAQGKFNPFKDDDMRRQLVDTIRCLRTLRKLIKAVDAKYSVNLLPKIIVYLQT